MDFPDQRKRCHLYVDALEEERRKIQVFRRELPLCLELVTQAIEACRRELPGSTEECSERSSSGGGPVLEEFIPINPHRTHHSSDDEDGEENENENEKKENEYHRNTSLHEEADRRGGQEEEKEMEDNNKNSTGSSNQKSDWLRSVQLWNQSPDPPPPVNEPVPRKAVVKEVKRNGSAGAFQPFQKETNNVAVAAAAAEAAAPPSSVQSSTAAAAGTGGSATSSNKQQQKDADNKEAQQRKQRRCWSPELHRRFLHALQQLGGSHVATPKQIRELMKVDGLTNDEVKSHLQKYRLHTRRPSHGGQNASNPAGPQFVVVGGIWVPPSAEYAAAGGSGSIYAPVARTTAEAQRQQASSLQSEGRGSSRSEGGVHHPYSSPSTCSSTHTATSSPEV